MSEPVLTQVEGLDGAYLLQRKTLLLGHDLSASRNVRERIPIGGKQSLADRPVEERPDDPKRLVDRTGTVAAGRGEKRLEAA